MTKESTLESLEKAYRDALAAFKADKTNKDLRRARTAAKRAWDEAMLQECEDEGAQQLHCKDCSQMFLWTTKEQEYYKAADRMWRHKPTRCRKCAELQKNRRKEDTATKKAGKNMCYAFQKGKCPYGDLCKFNHDPEFAGKKKDDDNESDDENQTKKQKVVPDVIALCKWGKDCKIKKCRYKHDSGEGATLQPVSATKPIHQQTANDEGENATTICIPVSDNNSNNNTTNKNDSAKKPKLLGICKWGKNCKIKRCRFQHPDDASPPELPLEEKTPKTDESSATKDKNKSKSKPSTKSTDKLVHKAMKKALKKAPQNKLRVKDLRKLVQKKMEDVGKDEIKIVVKKAIANNKDSMALLEDGTFVKLLV